MRKIGMFLWFAFLPLSLTIPAQPQPLSKPSAPVAETIRLGNSAATLPGQWKFAPGDSPWQHGSPVWAPAWLRRRKLGHYGSRAQSGLRRSSASIAPAPSAISQPPAFGQNDDITVLRIEFTGAPGEASAEALVTP